MTLKLLQTALSCSRSEYLIPSLCITVVTVNVCLYYAITGGTRMKRISKAGTTHVNGTSPTDVTTQWQHKHPGTVDAYRTLGYSDITLMRDMTQLRPLFNFTLLPWKIRPNQSRHISKAIIDQHVNWSMIVAVKSQSGHVNRRIVARETWGSFRYLDGVRLETIFIVGRGSDAKSEMQLLEENKEHGDILQIDRDEVDVGFKTLAGMQWVSQNFPPYWLHTSADDDMLPNLRELYVNIENMMTLGSKIYRSPNQGINASVFQPHNMMNLPIHCGYALTIGKGPFRGTCKWCVDHDTYPLKKYPPFCHGGWYSMPVSLASGIYDLSRTRTYYRMDDVWITGLLRLSFFSKHDIRYYFGFYNSDERIGIWTEDPGAAEHCFNENRVLRIWKDIEQKILTEAREYIRSK